MKVTGIYDLKNGSCTVQSEGAYYYENDVCKAWVLSPVWCDVSDIVTKRSNNTNITDVEDMYLAFVYDTVKRELNIFSDITTSPYNMYFTCAEDKFYFSTSLKDLLSDSNIDRRLNLAAAKSFLANGYVVGSETLIEDVNKLWFGCEIECTLSGVSVNKISVPHLCEKSTDAKKQLLPTMRKSIVHNIDDNGMISMPLSNGYDSNLILDTVRKHTDRDINAFTIGGKNGTNEIERVKENISNIDGIKLNTELIDDSYFEQFADIVWRLEGCVYESGVFLQYALATAASKSGAKYLLCGEGSDEVQNKYYTHSMKRVLDGTAKMNMNYYTYSDPFIGTNLMIMKKSSIMLNSFGITGRYPFKSASVAVVASLCAKYNGTEKKLYKKLCRREFDENISKNILTRGGTTGAKTVISEKDLIQLKEVMAGNPLISTVRDNSMDIYTDKWTKNKRREQGIRRIISEIRDEGISKGLEKIKANRKNRWIVRLFKETYLVLFNELFVSRKYDEFFETECLPVKTRDVISK